MSEVNKNNYDVVQVFHTYLTFNGDVDKTAIAVNVSREVVRELARSEGWLDKIKELNELRTGNSTELQIQINRAVNYVQAHRLRSILDKVVEHLQGMETNVLVDLLTKVTRDGSEFSARPLTDLVKASEACQAMTQRALGDTASERPEETEGKRGSSISLSVMRAMEVADQAGMSSVEVVKNQIQNAPTESTNASAS